jgi:hypothetical protein
VMNDVYNTNFLALGTFTSRSTDTPKSDEPMHQYVVATT